MAPVTRAAIVLSLVLLGLFAAGCGGADEEQPPATLGSPAPTTAPLTVTKPEETAQASAQPTGNPTFEIQLEGESPTATVGRPWRYTVRATSASGGSAGGTAKMRVFVDGELVDTIGYFAFNDVLTRTHKWPSILKGKKGIVLQAEVEGDGGTQRENYPVTVN
jgi:hypothetical protein